MFRRMQMLQSAAVLVIVLALLLLFFDVWKISYHGVGPGLWCAFTYAVGLVSAFAYLEHRTRKEMGNSVVAVASRRWVYARHLAADVVRITLIPLAGASAFALVASAAIHGRGYLQTEYILLTGMLLVLAILVGWLVSYLIEQPIVGALFSCVYSLFLSFYNIQSGSDGDAWTAFDSRSYVRFAILIFVVALGIIGCRMASRQRLTKAISSLAFVVVALITWFGGYIDVGIEPRTDSAEPSCTAAGIDRICVWPEDAYKLSTLTMHAKNYREAIEEAGITLEPTLYMEPNIMSEAGEAFEWDPENATWMKVIYPTGGEERTWFGARSFIDPAHMSCNGAESSTETAQQAGNYFLVLDLLTNWVYGDIGYNGYGTENLDYTENSHSRSAQLATLSPEEQLNELGRILKTYRDTCEVPN